jgi:hypothetical protein
MKYSPVTGYFEQDEPETDPRGYDFVSLHLESRSHKTYNPQATHNFGLIERAYDTDAEFDPDHKKTQWQRFHYHVDELNEHAGSNVQYKILYRWLSSAISSLYTY